MRRPLPKRVLRRDPKRYAQTLSPDLPIVRSGWTEIYPRAGLTDFNHAYQFSDWLHDRDDWRWHLVKATADVRSGQPGGRHFVRPDGVMARYSTTTGADNNYVRHDGGNANQGGTIRGVFSTAIPSGSNVIVRTTHPSTTEGVETHHNAVMTPDEYNTMRSDAATAGVDFPELFPKPPAAQPERLSQLPRRRLHA